MVRMLEPVFTTASTFLPLLAVAIASGSAYGDDKRRTTHSRRIEESCTDRFRSLLPIPIGNFLALDTTQRPRHGR